MSDVNISSILQLLYNQMQCLESLASWQRQSSAILELALSADNLQGVYDILLILSDLNKQANDFSNKAIGDNMKMLKGMIQ